MLLPDVEIFLISNPRMCLLCYFTVSWMTHLYSFLVNDIEFWVFYTLPLKNLKSNFRFSFWIKIHAATSKIVEVLLRFFFACEPWFRLIQLIYLTWPAATYVGSSVSRVTLHYPTKWKQENIITRKIQWFLLIVKIRHILQKTHSPTKLNVLGKLQIVFFSQKNFEL